MSFNNSPPTLDLLTSLFRNIALNNFSDLGTQQYLLSHILVHGIADPKTLAADLLKALTGFSKLFNNKEEEEKLANKSQLIFLTLENLIFNVYSKLKHTENAKSQDFLPQAQSSLSYSAINLESPVQVLHNEKFNKLMKKLLGNQNFFEALLKVIPKTLEEKNSQLVAIQVKNLISTFEYITETEGIKSDVFVAKKKKFIQYIRIAPEKSPVKESIKSINKIIFSGNIQKISELISQQKEDRQSFQISLLRIFSYYCRNVSNPKYFDSTSISGMETINRCITTYINSKAQEPKDFLFRENRSTEPLLDLILTYMTLHFLPVLRTFDDYLEKYLLPLAHLDAVNFFSKFATHGLQQAEILLECLPLKFKDFLRKFYNAINAAEFTDKLVASAPIKTLIFHRFFFNFEIRGFLHKANMMDTSPKKQDPTEFLKAGSYFKDLFYEASLKKHAGIPEFMQAYKVLNELFEDILTKKRVFKNELQVPQHLKFYVTKALLRYDYTIIKPAIDRAVEFEKDKELEKLEMDESEQVEDELEKESEMMDSGDEDIHDSERRPREEVYNASKDRRIVISSSDIDREERRGSNQAVRKIIDCEDFTGSVDDEDYSNIMRKKSSKEERKEHTNMEIKDFWKAEPEKPLKNESKGDKKDIFEKKIQKKDSNWYYAQQQEKVYSIEKGQGNKKIDVKDGKVVENKIEDDWYTLIDSPASRERFGTIQKELENELKGKTKTERDKKRTEDNTFYQLYNEIVQEREKGLQWNV